LVCSKGALLQLWDTEKGCQIWKAKNLPNDELDLAIPIWDTDAAMKGPSQIATCTAYGELRAYDTKQKRPLHHISEISNGIPLSNIIRSAARSHLFYTSSQEGHIFMLEERKSKYLLSQNFLDFKLIKKFTGSKGSIR